MNCLRVLYRDCVKAPSKVAKHQEEAGFITIFLGGELQSLPKLKMENTDHCVV